MDSKSRQYSVSDFVFADNLPGVDMTESSHPSRSSTVSVMIGTPQYGGLVPPDTGPWTGGVFFDFGAGGKTTFPLLRPNKLSVLQST